MKDFASHAKPLHQLAEKKSTFKWTTDCQAVFDHLKQCLTSAPTLTMPNWSRSFIIDTDASDISIGTVLSQVDDEGVEHVFAYASRILTKSERNYCITRKELLAVVTFCSVLLPVLTRARVYSAHRPRCPYLAPAV